MDPSHLLSAGKLPWNSLPLSARVDLLGLLSGVRPAIRLTHGFSDEVPETIAVWAVESGLGSASDDEHTVISAEGPYARLVLEWDRATVPHEGELGSLLGYPACCTQAIGAIGERHIDAAASRAAGWEFDGEFQLIDVAQYGEGLALLSHVPCSPRCQASLGQALAIRSFLAIAPVGRPGEPWGTWSAIRDWSDARIGQERA